MAGLQSMLRATLPRRGNLYSFPFHQLSGDSLRATGLSDIQCSKPREYIFGAGIFSQYYSKKSMYILIIPDNKPSHLENKAVDPQEGTFLPSLPLTAVLKRPFLFDVTDFQFRHIDDVTHRYVN